MLSWLLEVANLHLAISPGGFLSRSRDDSMLLLICLEVKVRDKHHSVNKFMRRLIPVSVNDHKRNASTKCYGCSETP